ncbi:hypothetical protein O181_002264 [Austropuccinia psidii MF-1]|uniref:Uncharacterized protein n=1 Tax=Austropuccinia psidii MF-1 TaxID=1389203 RepID=A0A9Q3GCP0_9BASI|nr:hypothetical protein [Austropuccinia psidii MF-1]
MTSKRGSQYSIQSDETGLRSRIAPSKGKKGKAPSGTEYLKGSAISQRQVQEMPIISNPELELSMSNSNRYKSHSEGSNRHIHELVQTVLHCVQGQGLGIAATSPPGSDKLVAHPEKVSQRQGNSEIIQWMESTIIQTSHQKDKGIPCQKEGGKKGRSPSSFYQQATSQPTSSKGEEEQEKEFEETICPNLQDSENPKRCHGQEHDGIEGQSGTKNETTPFPKEITLSPDVVNILREIENSILPLQDIGSS